MGRKLNQFGDHYRIIWTEAFGNPCSLAFVQAATSSNIVTGMTPDILASKNSFCHTHNQVFVDIRKQLGLPCSRGQGQQGSGQPTLHLSALSTRATGWASMCSRGQGSRPCT